MMKVNNRSIYGPLALAFAFLGCIGISVVVFSFVKERQSRVEPTDKPRTDPSTGNKTSESKTITVDARQVWVNTGIQVGTDDVIRISATGQVNIASPGDGADKWVGPDGWGYIPLFYCDGRPCKYVYRTPDSSGCLIGKVGTTKPFSVGSHYASTFRSDGTLYLSVNDVVSDQYGTVLDDSRAAALMFSDNRGSFEASVQIEKRPK